jgi:hypothetical protein
MMSSEKVFQKKHDEKAPGFFPPPLQTLFDTVVKPKKIQTSR